MPTTFEDVKLGPCKVTFGTEEIELTKGGVTLRIQPMYKEITVDQHGSSVVDDRITGWDVRAIVPMLKTDYDSMKAVAVFMEEQGGGVLVDRKLGTSMRGAALELNLHPTENAVGDLSEDATFWLAAPVTGMELGYSYDNERIYNVEFRAYPKTDADPGEPANYFVIGDPGDLADLEVVTFTCEDVATDPVPGVRVTVVGRGSKSTNAAGEAIFYLPDGDYVYAAEKAPYNTAYDDITVAGAALPVPVTMTV